MNEGKVGAPYEFPENYVQFAALWYEFFRLPYQQLEGALMKLGELLLELDVKNGKLLSFEVTDERTADLKVFEDLVGNLKLKGCLADGAYDSEEIFEPYNFVTRI